MSRAELPKVKPRSRKEIEYSATQLLRRTYPDCLDSPKEIPIAEFVEFGLPEIFGVDIRFSTLPSPTEAVMTPGNLRDGTATRVIITPAVYSAMVDGDGRARFTGGHESYHAIVHAKELQTTLSDGPIQGLFRSGTIKTYENPEWQANVFAAALLMPEVTVRMLIGQYGPDPDILMKTFGVSYQAALIRLERLGLL